MEKREISDEEIVKSLIKGLFIIGFGGFIIYQIITAPAPEKDQPKDDVETQQACLRSNGYAVPYLWGKNTYYECFENKFAYCSKKASNTFYHLKDASWGTDQNNQDAISKSMNQYIEKCMSQ